MLNPVDGAGLFCGVVDYFLGLGDESPKIVGATHFHEILEPQFMGSRHRLGFGHMDVRINREASGIGDQITYLYRSEFHSLCIQTTATKMRLSLRSGRSMKSFGIMQVA